MNEFIARNGVIAQNNSIVSGSLLVTSGITGSLFGTASYAISSSYAVSSSNTISASYATTASYLLNAVSSSNAVSASYATTASYVLNAVSASYADNSVSASYALNATTASNSLTASYVNPLHQIVEITSSTTAASLLGSGSGLFTVDGTYGRIFTIDDTISGSLFSVVTGSWPIFEVFSSKLAIISGSLDVSSGITGSLFGTASQAISASYALTASYVSGSADSSTSASYALSASYASTSSYAFAFPDQGFQYTQSIGSDTWNVVHNLNTSTPLVDVYDSSYNQLIPAGIFSVNANTTRISFSTAQAGYAIISKGSGISSQTAISASYATTASYASTVGFNFQQIAPSATWTIAHNLNNQYPLVQIYDSNNSTFIPQSINGSSVNTTIVTFSTAVSGYARVV